MASKLERRQAELEEKEKEALLAIKEDLAKWLSTLLKSSITAESFMDELKSAVPLCKLANLIRAAAAEEQPTSETRPHPSVPTVEVQCDSSVATNFHKFRAMSNAASFIDWCKKVEGVHIVFESEGLVENKDERSVILCLLDLARVADKLGMTPPELVKMEREIDLIENTDTGLQAAGKRPQRAVSPTKPKKIKRDPLDEKLLQLFNQCTCEKKLQAICYGGGKFQIITDRKTTIIVKVLSDRVVVRVGGGWDTLDHFLLKHDPCRSCLNVRASSLKSAPAAPTPQMKRQTRKRPAATPSDRSSKSRTLDSTDSGKQPVQRKKKVS